MELLIGRFAAPPSPPTSEERTMALLGVGLSLLFPAVAPLVVWAIQKDKMPYVARACWRIMIFDGILMAAVFVIMAIAAVTMCIPVLNILTMLLAMMLALALSAWALLVTIMALVRISEGQEYVPPIVDGLIAPPASAAPTPAPQPEAGAPPPPEPPRTSA